MYRDYSKGLRKHPCGVPVLRIIVEDDCGPWNRESRNQWQTGGANSYSLEMSLDELIMLKAKL